MKLWSISQIQEWLVFLSFSLQIHLNIFFLQATPQHVSRLLEKYQNTAELNGIMKLLVKEKQTKLNGMPKKVKLFQKQFY